MVFPFTSCFGVSNIQLDVDLYGFTYYASYGDGPDGSDGGALVWPGVRNSVLIPNSYLAVDFVYSFTILLHLKPAESRSALIFKFGPYRHLALWQEGLNIRVDMPIRGSGNLVADDITRVTGDPLTPGQWSFIAISFDFDSGNFTVAVDNNTAQASYPLRPVASNAWVRMFSNNNYHYLGSISCLQMYDSFLSQEQIDALETCPVGKMSYILWVWIVYWINRHRLSNGLLQERRNSSTFLALTHRIDLWYSWGKQSYAIC